MIATTTRTAPRRRWWAPGSPAYDRPAEVLAVLQHARAIVESGWVQNRWTAATAATGATTPTAPADGGARACLVAAVALAVRARDRRADLAVGTGPALGYVWDTVFDAPDPDRVAGRSAPHHVRVQRMRELASWNDEPGRSRDDIVAALDRAAVAVVARVVEPARR